jgi:hypothetical protein
MADLSHFLNSCGALLLLSCCSVVPGVRGDSRSPNARELACAWFVDAGGAAAAEAHFVRPGALISSWMTEGGRPMVGVRCFRLVLGALLPVTLAAQELPRQVEPERLWRLDTGG